MLKIFLFMFFITLSGFLFAACGGKGLVGREELPQRFDEMYEAKQLSPEQKKAEFMELVKSLDPELHEWFTKQLEAARPARQDEFNQWYDARLPSEYEKRAEALKLFKELILSGGHETPSLSLELSRINPETEVVDSARRISAEVVLTGTVEELREIYRKFGGADSSKEEKSAEELLPPSTVISSSGIATVVLYKPYTTVGYLGPKHVMTHGRFYSIICMGITELPPEIQEKVFATFKIIPNSEEGQWKEEMLVSNRKVLDMCEGKEGDPKYYPQVDFVVFPRPEAESSSAPDISPPVKVAKLSDIEAGGWLLFPATTARGLIMSYGMVVNINAGSAFGPPSIEFMGVPAIAPGPWDIGAPVYYIAKSAEDPVRLVGFISNAGNVPASIIPAYFILGSIKEFSHELILDPP